MYFWNYFMCAVVVLIFLYKYLTRNYKYWTYRGIPTAKGLFPGFGHMISIFMCKKSFSFKLHEIHATSNASMVGIFEKNKPVLLVRDPELVKTVLQTDFVSFSDHIPLDQQSDPLLAMDPFFVNGDMWKHTRGVFTSAFSSKKLKFIAALAKYECEKFVNFISEKFEGRSENTVEIEAKELFSKFTSQLAANAIFGISDTAFVDVDLPESLNGMMKSTLEVNIWKVIRQKIIFLLPCTNNLLNDSFVPQQINRRFLKIVAKISELKKSQAVRREDLLQHIIDYEAVNSNSDELVAAHAFSFFLESYETSSLILSAATYLLAKHQNFQEKAREEVIRLINQHGGICYEAINEMNFLEQVLCETLRLFSPVGKLHKICSKAVNLDGPDGLCCPLKPGDEVVISVMGLHMDPKIWTNPEKFNPDRFAKDSSESKNKFAFLAFGEGPRMCPGKRMGFLQTKAALAAILEKFVIKASSKMVEPVTLDPNYFLNFVIGGFWVEFQRL